VSPGWQSCQILLLLIDVLTDAEATDGSTALHSAAVTTYIEVARFLYEQGRKEPNYLCAVCCGTSDTVAYFVRSPTKTPS
jgi:hypothetical protein